MEYSIPVSGKNVLRATAERPAKKPSLSALIFSRFIRDPLAATGTVLILAAVLCALILPLVLPLDPYISHSGKFYAPPEAGHILGFDDLGRDVLSRLIYGSRTSLLVGFLSTILSLAIGLPLGLLAGYYRGPIEMIVMRLSDLFMVFPGMILILVFVALVGPSFFSVIVILGVLRWPSFARMLYGRVLSAREEEYIEAARAMGANDFVILFKYILPNTAAPIIVQSAFAFSNSMTFEAGLSFLGVGIQPPMASWGNMLYNAQTISVLAYKPWIWVPAGLMLALMIFSANFIGDGVRRALDPKAKI
jgi:peptide/nickel transport system permease protein